MRSYVRRPRERPAVGRLGDEEQVWEFVRGLLRDPERIRAGIDRLIEEERTEAGRDPERDAEFWKRKLTEVEVERRGYHRRLRAGGGSRGDGFVG